MKKNKMKKQTQFHLLSEAKSEFTPARRGFIGKKTNPIRHPNLNTSDRFAPIRQDSWFTIPRQPEKTKPILTNP
jgi:hypothetical protein